MQIHIVFLRNIIAGVVLTLGLTGIIFGNGYKYLRRKFQKKIRDEKDVLLVQQTREQFQDMLARNLTFPIAMA